MTAEVLRRAADLLRERGWCQGTFRDKEGRQCVAGAINAVVRELGPGVEAHYFHAMEAARRRLAIHPSFDPQGAILSWNDVPGRTQEEVVDLLLRAATDVDGGRP